MNKRVIYIAGYGRSGSTLLERLLASSDEIAATGESGNVARAYAEQEQCACGQTVLECSQWRGFFLKFGSGLDQYEKLRRRYESNWGFLFRSAHHQQTLARQFDYLMKTTGKHLVDSSKTTRVSAFRPFLLAKSHDLKLIHIVKDGRACLASNLRGSNQKLSRGRKDATYRFAFLKTIWAWMTANQVAELFGIRFPENYMRVRFEDLVDRPEETLLRIQEFVGVDLQQSIAIARESREIPLAHQIAGNRMGQAPGVKMKKAGTNDFSSAKFRVFAIINWMRMRRYGYFSELQSRK